MTEFIIFIVGTVVGYMFNNYLNERRNHNSREYLAMAEDVWKESQKLRR